MLGWIGFILSFSFAVYQYFNPRILCKIHYCIENRKCENVLAKATLADCAGLYSNSGQDHQRHVNLIGKVIELKSAGNVAARGVLIHARLKYPIYDWLVAKDLHTDPPYGQIDDGEFNLKIDCLNPTDELRIFLWCAAESVQDGEDLLLEHRITLTEGKARQVKTL